MKGCYLDILIAHLFTLKNKIPTILLTLTVLVMTIDALRHFETG